MFTPTKPAVNQLVFFCVNYALLIRRAASKKVGKLFVSSKASIDRITA